MSGRRSKVAHMGSGDACCIGNIEVIVVKILLKLPVSSVLKYKLVSKFWYQLIREPQFAQLQFSSLPKNPKLLLHLSGDDSEAHNNLYLMDRDGKVSPYVTLPNPDQNCSLRLISSFNGLICCTRLVGTDDLDIQICNPATRKVLQLPTGSPSATTPSVAFIFDPDKNKYKVLRFFDEAFESDEIDSKCEIYSPDGGDWRRISGVVQCPVVNPACPLFPTHLCIGGIVYWLVWSPEDREVPDHILSVDMDGNFSRLELPRATDDGPHEFNILTFLAEYKGHLALVGVDNEEIYLDVWSLTDPSESSWDLEGSAQLEIDGFVNGMNSIVSVGNELLFIINPGFATYFCFQFLNLVEKTWRKPNCCRFQIGSCEPVAIPFTESLFRCDIAN